MGEKINELSNRVKICLILNFGDKNLKIQIPGFASFTKTDKHELCPTTLCKAPVESFQVSLH